MATRLKYLSVIIALLVFIGSCEKKEYSMGTLAAPSEVVINTEIVGVDATHPNGDGSGDVKITVTGKNALSYKVDYDAGDAVDLVFLPKGTITKKYTKLGLNTYRITAVAYGQGATATTVTKDISVQSNFTPDPAIVENLTGGSSKTWIVDKSIPSHFGVGPWSATSVTPEWWSAGVNDKVACCNCFYTSEFKFTKVGTTGNYTLTVTSPDGVFTKPGEFAGGLPGVPPALPDIPIGNQEKCYTGYTGGTSGFSFVPSSSGVAASTPSTKTAIQLSGTNTFIGYGSVLKEYEIFSLSPTAMYLRVQGTETGNAWYLKLKVK